CTARVLRAPCCFSAAARAEFAKQALAHSEGDITRAKQLELAITGTAERKGTTANANNAKQALTLG
ncbi:MAG TPA: hypothetical protein VKS00_01060, partial [Candidatus Acidoferrales bacterium]|nr:hypothetical protein [Candidatus Acidoferrales bacterium]